MKPVILNKSDLEEWMRTERLMYASNGAGGSEHKRLYVGLDGTLYVELGPQSVYEGRDTDKAIEAFNAD